MLVLAESNAALVEERWTRALQLGVRRDSSATPVVTSDADLVARRERLAEIFREEQGLLAPISEQLACGPRVAIVADREGVILTSRADRHIVDPITRVRLVPGARWDEGTRGTNAIGTAIVEGRAVSVIGKAHFETRNGGIFCCATPIRDVHGDIVAVLDVSGPIGDHDPSVALAVQAAGVALERALRTVGYGDPHGSAMSAIFGLVRRSAGPALLIEASGVVRVVNAAAHRDLPLPNSALTCEHVFGVSFPELVATSMQHGGMHFETRTGSWRIEIDPIARGSRSLAAVVHFERERQHAHSPPALVPRPAMDAILGEDAALNLAKQSAERFAKTELPVMLLAETGTGKELFARAIHACSERRKGPFVAVNCGALSPALIASELFGHAPGAFTGASRGGSEGRIAAAHGGTLFLDEIAEMPEQLQVALLRVLDDGVYQRVGDTRERRADFRLVCATCRDLPALLDQGKFRNDLYYRIQGARLSIPPLRARTDVEWLAERFVERLAPSSVLEEDARAWIRDHDWPGNVRELKSAIMHAVALSAGESSITRAHLPESARRRPRDEAAPSTRRGVFQNVVKSTLEACGGNVSEAARRLGIGRNTLYRALKRDP